MSFDNFSEYLKEKKEEEEILAELAKKYRDRAKERRDGGEASGPDALATLGAYRAVAPDIKSYYCHTFLPKNFKQ